MKKSVISLKNTAKNSRFSRRDFIKVAGIVAGSAALAACAPQVTVTPEATFTSPPPTNTLEPTSTPHPEIPVEIQDEFKDSKIFKLNLDGTVSVLPQEEGGEEIKIEGFQISQDGKTATLKYGEGENDKNKQYIGKTFNIDPKSIYVDPSDKTRLLFTETEKDGAMKWFFNPKLGMCPEITKETADTRVLHDVGGASYFSQPEFFEWLSKIKASGRLTHLNFQKKVALENILVNVDDTCIPIQNITRDDFAHIFEPDKNLNIYSHEQKPAELITTFRTSCLDGQVPLLACLTLWKDATDEPKFIISYVFDNKDPDILDRWAQGALNDTKMSEIPGVKSFTKEGLRKSMKGFGIKEGTASALEQLYFNTLLLRFSPDAINALKDDCILNTPDYIPSAYFSGLRI